MFEVLGIGDADIDIYLEVDHIPARDEKILASSVELHPGGMVANYVVALQKLGTPCGFHGTVGDDDFGRKAIANFELHGVDTSGVIIKQGQQTYFCTVILDSSGEKALIVAPTPSIFPQPDDIRSDLIALARHVHTTGANASTLKKTLEACQKHGVPISVDLEPSALRQSGIGQLLRGVDILFVNQRAIDALGATSPEEAAIALRTQGVPTVCITMGAGGVVAAQRDRVVHAAAYKVPVVDTTGAGDCFAAGFTFGMLQKWSLDRTLTFANAVAAVKIMKRGGHSGSPHLDEVNEFIARNPITPPDFL